MRGCTRLYWRRAGATRLGSITGGGPKHLLPIGARARSLTSWWTRLGAIPEVEQVTVITHGRVSSNCFLGRGRPRGRGQTARDRHERMARPRWTTRLGAVGGDMAHFIRGVGHRRRSCGGRWRTNLFDFNLAPGSAGCAATGLRHRTLRLWFTQNLRLSTGVVEVDGTTALSPALSKKPEHPGQYPDFNRCLWNPTRGAWRSWQAYLDAGGDPDKVRRPDRLGCIRASGCWGQVFSGRWIGHWQPRTSTRAPRLNSAGDSSPGPRLEAPRNHEASSWPSRSASPAGSNPLCDGGDLRRSLRPRSDLLTPAPAFAFVASTGMFVGCAVAAAY